MSRAGAGDSNSELGTELIVTISLILRWTLFGFQMLKDHRDLLLSVVDVYCWCLSQVSVASLAIWCCLLLLPHLLSGTVSVASLSVAYKSSQSIDAKQTYHTCLPKKVGLEFIFGFSIWSFYLESFRRYFEVSLASRSVSLASLRCHSG